MTRNEPEFTATFGPLVPVCKAHGIGRTKAFELAGTGMIETFALGTRRYVVLDSLRTLPARLRDGDHLKSAA